MLYPLVDYRDWLEFIGTVATGRRRVHARAGTATKCPRTDIDDIQIDINGATGEVVGSIVFRQNPREDVLVLERGPYPPYDFVWNKTGETVETKMTERYGYRFLIPDKYGKPETLKADYGLLVWPADFEGFAIVPKIVTRAEFQDRCYRFNPGYNWCTAIEVDDMQDFGAWRANQ